MWRVDGEYVRNEKGKVISVSGSLDNENRNIIVENKNGNNATNANQRWKIIYVD
jgi:hypothetical protein